MGSNPIIHLYFFIVYFMKLLYLKPNSPGTRHKIKVDKSGLSKNVIFVKSLVFGFKKFFGRSSKTGNITSWHKGGGNKTLYRRINYFSQNMLSVKLFNFYNPNKNSFISLTFDFLRKKFFFQTLLNSGVIGALTLCTTKKLIYSLSHRNLLKNLPIGSLICELSLKNNKISQYSRSAGTFCLLISLINNIAKIKLPSSQIIFINVNCFATVGTISNIFFNRQIFGKAGIFRNKNKRPTVRGIAMNPVDHPHGGRTNGGRFCVTPWGKLTKGPKTSNSNIKKLYLKKKKK